MVTKKVQDLFLSYEDTLLFKKVVLLHKEARRQEVYGLMLCDQINAISSQSIQYPDQSYKKLVLDQSKIKGYHVFQLQEKASLGNYVSLAVVESLLRRKVQGIRFEEVEVV